MTIALNTELVDISKNIKWTFIGDSHDKPFIDFQPFERRLVPMVFDWADKVPSRDKKDALVQITFSKSPVCPLVFADGTPTATLKELMEDIYLVPVINYTNAPYRLYVEGITEVNDMLVFKKFVYTLKETTKSTKNTHKKN